MGEGIPTCGEGIARWFRVLSVGLKGVMCQKDGDKHIMKQTNKKNLKGNNFELNSKTNKELINVATFSFFKKALTFWIRK